MLRKGQLDQCGVTLLAGEAVGAPFVGSVAACLTVSEVLRLLHGGAQKRDFSALNPGYVAAASAG